MTRETPPLLSASFVEEQYVRYLKKDQTLDPSWKLYFENFSDFSLEKPAPLAGDVRVFNLIQAYRTFGHLAASINPLASPSQRTPRELQLATHYFKEEELTKKFPTFSLLPEPEASLEKILSVLKAIYCDKIGYEFMGTENTELLGWIQRHIEPLQGKISLPLEQKKYTLEYLNRSELLETFIHTKYPGQKRFSLEGGESLIPMLALIIEIASRQEVSELIIGMAHRGRLNVLCNILDKSYEEVFSEFEEGYFPETLDTSGDVKYHKGFRSVITTRAGKKVKLTVANNPSHLESVDAVVEGQTFARQLLHMREGGAKKDVIPLLIHGDAALAGQGVVYETLQMMNLGGYATAGTLHIVINNQIGFTTRPYEGRSTYYCTDVARAFGAPVFHVNGEHPEECVFVGLLALEIRQRFGLDVFIDLNCYRKYGHNEGDEPAFTQPIEYQIIKKKPPVRDLYLQKLQQTETFDSSLVKEFEEDFKRGLSMALEKARSTAKKTSGSTLLDPFKKVKTSVPKEKLLDLSKRLASVPPGFSLHKKIESLNVERVDMAEGKRGFDFGAAETLAYATLLSEGVDIRLAGQDSCRGTFSHRHAVWMDQLTEGHHIPLKNIGGRQGDFSIYNSPLSEYAALGFEYGYSLGLPDGLTIWEAQFGDFCNGAQIIIDQYIATSQQKWSQTSGIVLFLPHGYEGQGPEHSSCRLERFLILAGNHNMQIVYPSLPAQLFHLLRRQVMRKPETPLIILTPKALLRHPACTSSLDDLAQGEFHEILKDPTEPQNPKRVLFCTGHVYVELAPHKLPTDALVRIEQIYPLHKESLSAVIESYKGLEEAIWVQEEPKNMGAWSFIHTEIQQLLPKGMELKYMGRQVSASPAVGSYALHKNEHKEILHTLFGSVK